MPTEPSAPVIDRFYVDDLYCALHRAAPAKRRGVSVVFSPAMGRDARWAYRSLVVFADALATAGFDVLRFDPAGEGDSGEIALDADQTPLWTSGLVKAAEQARALTGADRTVLLGLRMGATLARLVAKDARADGLVLLDPLASGAAWLQELRMLEMMAIEPKPEQSAVEALGLRLSHATKVSLEAIDLAALPALDIPSLYASPIKNNGVIAGLGPAASVIPFKGYASFFKEGHLNTYPEWTFDQVRDWLLKTFPARAGAAPASAPAAQTLSADGYVEAPVVLGDGQYAILTRPAEGAPRRSVVIGNTGADPRAGTGGFAARMARTLARHGVATLRVDFDGLGESNLRQAERSAVYEQPRTEAFRAGARLLAERGLPAPDLIGVCTGGFHAVQALLDDRSFGRVLAINAWLMFRPGSPLERESFVRSLRTKFMNAQPELAAKIDPLLDTARALVPAGQARPAAAAEAPAEKPYVGVDQIDPIARTALERIETALGAGQSLCLLMGHRDPSRGGMDHFGDDGLERLDRAGLVQDFEPIDHGLFSLDSQTIVLNRVVAFLETPSRLDKTVINA